MALVSDRNIQLTGADAEARALQFLIKLKEVLDTAGWTIIGYGDGVDDSDFNLAGVTDTFPAFPSTTGMDDGAWFAAESASGAHCVFQVTSASGYVQMWVSAKGSYTDDGVGYDTRVGGTTPPSDEQQVGSSSIYFGQNANQKYSIIYDNGGDSFVLFGAYGGNDNFRGFFLKLTGYKTGDTYPFVYSWTATASGDEWQRGDLTQPATDSVLGWHPDDHAAEYAFGHLYFDSVDVMDVIPADPVSGDEQILDCLVGCQVAASYHIRGVAPIIRQMSGLRATGDKFSSDQFVGIGDFALDGWSSSDALES